MNYKEDFQLLVENKKKGWKQQAVAHTKLCLANPSEMAEAINRRQSISKINTDNIPEAYTKFDATELGIALEAIDKGDLATYSYYDRSRLGNSLKDAEFSIKRTRSNETLSDFKV